MKLTFRQNIQLLQNHASAKDWRRLLTTCFPMPKWLYEAYLKSAAWKVKREARLLIDENRCQGCMNCGFLDVHHKTYQNIGDEDVNNDLVSLCRTCHTATHAAKTLLTTEIATLTGEWQSMRGQETDSAHGNGGF